MDDFPQFEIREQQRQLVVEGRTVPLGARAFDVLTVLVELSDRVVGKDELLDRGWPGVVVEENNLQVQIHALRKALGARAIVTVPGRGYRFAAPLPDRGNAAGRPVNAPVLTTVATTIATATSPIPLAPAPAPAGARRTNLPERQPPLFGRDPDIAMVRALLEGHRVVSIVASSGIGKTRLARSVADALADRYPDGTWQIELAALADGELVAAEVVRVLGFTRPAGSTAQDAVIDILRSRSLLLLLDNCEHLLESVASLVQAIVEHAPGVRILATSIEPLRTPDEHVYRLEPLHLPASSQLDDAQASGAVQLFVNRVTAVDRTFVLTPANVDNAIALCRRLDGIPLALELAAARVTLLGLSGLLERLDQRFRILTSGSRYSLRRHQTLRAALDFSHGLLTPNEQAVLRRLGVFAGSFTVESAQDVAADNDADRWPVLDILGTLVDKSMVLAEHGDSPRLRLLETTKSYALEKLDEAGESDALRARHAEVMAALFARSHHAYFHASSATETSRFWPEIDNLRAALSWSIASDAERAIELAGNGGLLWLQLDLQLEGVGWFEAALAGVTQSTPALPHGRLWHALAWMLAWVQPARSQSAAVRAAELLRQTGDTATLGMALLVTVLKSKSPAARQSAFDEMQRLQRADASPAVRAQLANATAGLAMLEGRYAEARREYAEGARLLSSAGTLHWQSAMQRSVGEAAMLMGDLDFAIAHLRRTAQHLASLNLKGIYLALTLGDLATACLWNGDAAGARAALSEAAPNIIRHDLGVRFAATAALLAAQEGRHAAAARLLGYEKSALAALADDVANEPAEVIAHQRTLERLAAVRMPADEIDVEQRAGAALTAEAAYRLALAMPG